MKKIPLLFALAALAVSSQAVVGYSNVTTFTGSAYAGGNAALDGATTTSTSTALVADDIVFGSGLAGGSVTGFTFSVANLNATAASANANIRFYASNGTGSGPGTILGAFNFAPLSFGAGAISTVSYNPGTSLFTVPTNRFIWAGISFTNDSATATATTAQLNNLAQGIFNPPTVGSSQDVFFQSTAGGEHVPDEQPDRGPVQLRRHPGRQLRMGVQRHSRGHPRACLPRRPRRRRPRAPSPP